MSGLSALTIRAMDGDLKAFDQLYRVYEKTELMEDVKALKALAEDIVAAWGRNLERVDSLLTYLEHSNEMEKDENVDQD